MEKEGIKIIANNKKASYEYFLSDFLELFYKEQKLNL